MRSPFGSISNVGTPALSASSTRTIPSPVLPEPVMPTMTPWVVKSPEAIVVSWSVRWWVAGSICPPRRKSAMPGTLHGRSWSASRCFHPVRAPAIAGEHVLGAGDLDTGSECSSECVELGAAQCTARNGCLADRTVMLDQDEPGAVVVHLGEVALVGSQLCQPANALAEIGEVGQRVRIRQRLSIGAGSDHLVERTLAQARNVPTR